MWLFEYRAKAMEVLESSISIYLDIDNINWRYVSHTDGECQTTQMLTCTNTHKITHIDAISIHRYSFSSSSIVVERTCADSAQQQTLKCLVFRACIYASVRVCAWVFSWRRTQTLCMCACVYDETKAETYRNTRAGKRCTYSHLYLRYYFIIVWFAPR